MRKYSAKETALLVQAAIQLGECDKLLDRAGVPNVVENGGNKYNATHERLRYLLEQKTLPKVVMRKHFPWRVRYYWNKGQYFPFSGSNTTVEGNGCAWIGRMTWVFIKV